MIKFYHLLFFAALNMVFVSALAKEKSHGIKARTTLATPEEDDYDVQYVKMDLNASNLSTAITGHVTTRAKVVAPNMGEYYFELSNQVIIDSAKINGQILPTTTVNNFVRKITLPAALLQNAVFNADIFYHGAPAGGTGFFTNGILNQTDASIPVQVTHTVSAAFHARDWFPCKQSLTDKIDSSDVWVTVPDTLKVAGNGKLKNVTITTPGFHRYEWSERYPADYYLLSFAIAPYNEYNYYMHFTASNDSMLIQNFIYNNPTILQQHQDELDTIGLVVDYFSQLFGKYPFYKEKFGICQTPLGGGMENQTMVSLGSLETTLIAHELSHQWWGDNVTCQSLKDMWLNEGWATYCEQLFVEHFQGVAAAKTYRSNVFYYVINGFNTIGGSVYVTDTTSEGRIYDTRLTYYKGAAVAHMLRFVANNDNLYFQLLKDYHQQYQFGTATTEDFKNLAQQILNIPLDTFFNQWIYKEGYPIYTAKWSQDAVNSNVVIKLMQRTSKPTSVATFKLPVVVKLTSAQGDTLVRLNNDASTQRFTVNWGRQMTGLTIDPDDDILNKVDSVVHDPSILSVASISDKKIEIYPNPSSTSWTVKNTPLYAQLILTDMEGKKVWESVGNGDSIVIPATRLSAGIYTLSINDHGKVKSFNLQR